MSGPDHPDPAALELHLGHRAAAHPDHPAVIMAGSGEVTTYGMLDERSNRMAHALRAAGLRTGDHLALMMENSSALLEVTWAAQRAGLYYTALNSHLRRDEVQHILDDCGAVAFVVSARLGEVAAALDLDRIRLRVSGGWCAARVRALRPGPGRRSAHPGRRRGRGPRDALLVGDHGRAQGGCARR